MTILSAGAVRDAQTVYKTRPRFAGEYTGYVHAKSWTPVPPSLHGFPILASDLISTDYATI